LNNIFICSDIEVVDFHFAKLHIIAISTLQNSG